MLNKEQYILFEHQNQNTSVFIYLGQRAAFCNQYSNWWIAAKRWIVYFCMEIRSLIAVCVWCCWEVGAELGSVPALMIKNSSNKGRPKWKHSGKKSTWIYPYYMTDGAGNFPTQDEIFKKIVKPMEVKFRSKTSHWPKIPHRYARMNWERLLEMMK